MATRIIQNCCYKLLLIKLLIYHRLIGSTCILLFYVLILQLPITSWVGDSTNLPSNSNISKTVKVNIAFLQIFFEEYLIRFLMVYVSTIGLVVLNLLMFKVNEIIRISKINFFNFSGTEGVKQNQKIQINHFPSNFNKIRNFVGF